MVWQMKIFPNRDLAIYVYIASFSISLRCICQEISNGHVKESPIMHHSGFPMHTSPEMAYAVLISLINIWSTLSCTVNFMETKKECRLPG